VALIAVPAQVLVWIMIRVSLPAGAHGAGGGIYAATGTSVPTLAINLLGFLSGALAVGALTRLLIEAYTGRRTSWDEALGFASSHFAALLVLAVIVVVGLAVGYALFLVPGVFLTVAWSACVPALMFDRVRPTVALRRSMDLIAGNWFSAFGALVLALLIVVGISYLIVLVVAGIQSSSSIDVILTLQAVSRALSAILTYPLLAALSVVIYANLRAAKEGVRPEALMPRASAS
jgi:hypothetical protein